MLRILALGFASFAAWRASGLPGVGMSSTGVELLGALALAAGFFALSVLPLDMRVGASVSAMILGIGFILIDSYLGRVDVMMPDVAKARRLGVEFDGRLVKDVVLDGRARGESLTLPAFPADYRFAFGDDVIFCAPCALEGGLMQRARI